MDIGPSLPTTQLLGDEGEKERNGGNIRNMCANQLGFNIEGEVEIPPTLPCDGIKEEEKEPIYRSLGNILFQYILNRGSNK